MSGRRVEVFVYLAGFVLEQVTFNAVEPAVVTRFDPCLEVNNDLRE